MKIKLERYRDALRDVYDEIDKHISGVDGIICREGCHYCCEMTDVKMSPLEIANIVRKINKLKDREAVRTIKQRIDLLIVEHDRMGQANPDEQTNFYGPCCPFLINNRCAVYSVRPLTCRHYVSSSLEQCRRKETPSAALRFIKLSEYIKAEEKLIELNCEFLRAVFPEIKEQFNGSPRILAPVYSGIFIDSNYTAYFFSPFPECDWQFKVV